MSINNLFTSLNDISMVNHTKFGDFSVEFMAKLEEMVKLGYLPLNSLSILIDQMFIILPLAMEKKSEIKNKLYPTLCTIAPALDELRIHLDDATLGAITLISKSHYAMIWSKFGQFELECFLSRHYIRHPSYSKKSTEVQTKHGATNVPLNIIAMRKLRRLIGPEAYFKECNELFFQEDLEYVYQFSNVVLRIPRTVCVFCEEIETSQNKHDLCHYSYANKQSLHSYINKQSLLTVDEGVIKLHGTSSKNLNRLWDYQYNRNFNCDDNFFLFSPHGQKNCNYQVLNCQHLCPKLIKLSQENYDKYFSLETKFDTNLFLNGRASDGYYNIRDNMKQEIIYSAHLNNDRYLDIHRMIVELIKNKVRIEELPCNNLRNCRPAYGYSCHNHQINNICNNYVVPLSCIHCTITMWTPCHKCYMPKFLHGFRNW
jgi:hypothetical protein